MTRRGSISCKGLAALSLLALCFALVMPAMWTMRCVGTDRTSVQWGQAHECQAPVKQTDGPAMRVHCCSFSSVVSNVEDFSWEEGTSVFLVPVLFIDSPHYAPLAAVCCKDVQQHAHGPPWAERSRCLLATGQLRV